MDGEERYPVVDRETGEVVGHKTLEELTDKSAAEDHRPVPLREQLSLDVGGHEVTSSYVKFSGSLPLHGEFKKGDRVRVVIEGYISGVNTVDKEDKHGFVVATERTHTAKITGGQVDPGR